MAAHSYAEGGMAHPSTIAWGPGEGMGGRLTQALWRRLLVKQQAICVLVGCPAHNAVAGIGREGEPPALGILHTLQDDVLFEQAEMDDAASCVPDEQALDEDLGHVRTQLGKHIECPGANGFARRYHCLQQGMGVGACVTRAGAQPVGGWGFRALSPAHQPLLPC